MKLFCVLGIHQWDGCTCARCNRVRNQNHEWEDWRCKRCEVLNLRLAAEEMGKALVDLIGSARFARYVLPRGTSGFGTTGGGKREYLRVWKARGQLLTRLTAEELDAVKREATYVCGRSFREGINFSGSFNSSESWSVMASVISGTERFRERLGPVLDAIMLTDETSGETKPPSTWETRVEKAISTSMD